MGGDELESRRGITEPFRVVRRNCHRLMDSYGWKPMFSEWDYEQTYERIDSEVARLDQQRHSETGGEDVPLVLVSHNVPYGSQLDGVDNPELPDFAQGRMVGSHRCVAALNRLSPESRASSA